MLSHLRKHGLRIPKQVDQLVCSLLEDLHKPRILPFVGSFFALQGEKRTYKYHIVAKERVWPATQAHRW